MILLMLDFSSCCFRKQCAMNLMYFTYMGSVDVPNYVRGHIANMSNGKRYDSISVGLKSLVDISNHEITKQYAKWEYAMIWMTLYFSVACWASIALVNSPRMDKGLVQTAFAKNK